MPIKEAIVALHPLNVCDVLPYRSLKFTSDLEYVDIGRASKREAKNLSPTNRNGLFDSRVMSRNHARLWVSLEKKIVYLRDGGSMHGTWINGKKLVVGEDTTIADGDVISFGTEVVRGQETYPPLKVSCEFHWFESDSSAPNDITNKPKSATNTFCVPEDDDNDIEVASYLPRGISTAGSSSESDQDSENESVVEILSPVTSPLKGGSRGICGSQDSPIELDKEQAGQPLVTPRMTPSSAADPLVDSNLELHNDFDLVGQRSDDGSVLSSSDEGDLGSQANNCEGESSDADSEDDLMSESSFESDDELSITCKDHERVALPQPIEIHQHSQTDTPIDTGSLPSRTGFFAPDKESPPIGGVKGRPFEPFNIFPQPEYSVGNPVSRGNDPRPNSQDFQQAPAVAADIPCKSISPTWLSTGRPNVNTNDLRRSDAFFAPPSFNSEAKEWQPQTTFGQDCVLPPVVGREYPRALSLEEPPSPFLPYDDGPFVNTLPQPIAANSTPIAANNGDRTMGSSGEGRIANRRSDTRVSIADIIDATTWSTGPRMPLKRKAMDADMDSVHDTSASHNPASLEPTEGDSGETCLPDAQPQHIVEHLDSSSTQLTTLSAVDEPQAVAGTPQIATESGRPAKRLNTSDTNFRSHAATAILGAVVGAVGTVAALASLPPDYFT